MKCLHPVGAIFFLIALLGPAQSVAQGYKSGKTKKWKVSSTNIGFGTAFADKVSDFDALSDFVRNTDDLGLPADLTSYTDNCEPYCYLYNGIPLQLHMGLGFNRYNPETTEYNRRQELYLGGSVLFRSDRVAYLNEQSIGQDTFSFDVWAYRLAQLELAFDARYIFLTNPDKKLVAWAGAGQRTGMPLMNKIDELHTYGNSVLDDEAPNRYIYASSETYKKIKAHPVLDLRLFIPVGFRIALRQRVSLFLQGEAGFGYRQIFGGPGAIQPHLTAMLGFRIGWD